MNLKRPIKEIRTLKQTTRKLSQKSFIKKDFKNFFRPIDYTRTAEIPAVLYASNILIKMHKKLEILDISSPQILSLVLNNISNNWEIVYCNPFQPELDDMLRLCQNLSAKNISVQKIDITNNEDLKKIKHNFDYVFSSSVFEHIHPENGGDIKAVKNIYKLLKPGGLFVLSVPFYRERFSEYKFGDVYSVKGSENKKTFFQRFYDEESMNKQLINPSRLVLDSLLFLGERFYYPNNIHKRLAQRLQSKTASVLLGNIFFLISKICISYSDDYKRLKKPYIAVITLRKI